LARTDSSGYIIQFEREDVVHYRLLETKGIRITYSEENIFDLSEPIQHDKVKDHRLSDQRYYLYWSSIMM